MSTDTTVFRYQDQIDSLRARIAELEARVQRQIDARWEDHPYSLEIRAKEARLTRELSEAKARAEKAEAERDRLQAQITEILDTVDLVHDERIEDPLEAVSMLARSRDLFAREASDLRRELNGRLNHDCVLVESERDSLRDEVTDLHMVAQSIKHYWQCDPAAGIPCVRCQRDAIRAERDRYLAAIRDAVRAYNRLAKGGYGGDLAVVWSALRRIAEEKA